MPASCLAAAPSGARAPDLKRYQGTGTCLERKRQEWVHEGKSACCTICLSTKPAGQTHIARKMVWEVDSAPCAGCRIFCAAARSPSLSVDLLNVKANHLAPDFFIPLASHPASKPPSEYGRHTLKRSWTSSELFTVSVYNWGKHTFSVYKHRVSCDLCSRRICPRARQLLPSQ